MRLREFFAFLIQRGGMLARNFRNARTAEPALDANSLASLGIGLPPRLCEIIRQVPRRHLQNLATVRFDQVASGKSPLHSLTSKKANRRRKLALSPDYDN